MPVNAACPFLDLVCGPYLLFELVLAVVNDDGVVVAVEAVDEGLDGGLVQVPDVGGGLPGLLVQEHELRVNGPEGVDHHLALDRLDGVNHHRHSPLVQLLETLWWGGMEKRRSGHVPCQRGRAPPKTVPAGC